MTVSFLTLRINRRAIGAVVLREESLVLSDGRHLTSKVERTTPAAVRFLEYLLTVTKPSLVVVDAPSVMGDTVTTRIMQAIKEKVSGRGLRLMPVGKTEVLAAYGIKGLRSRGELRELIRHYWPELGTVRGKVEPFVIDAAAAALYAECRLNLEPIDA